MKNDEKKVSGKLLVEGRTEKKKKKKKRGGGERRKTGRLVDWSKKVSGKNLRVENACGIILIGNPLKRRCATTRETPFLVRL